MGIGQQRLLVLALSFGLLLTAGCSGSNDPSGGGASMKIAFLHHSTGRVVWRGTTSKWSAKLLGKSAVGNWMGDYNKATGTSYEIEEMNFPTTDEGYPWANYPYDYYNIWVKNAGAAPYQGEPTLEMLTKDYDVIVFKHCFPVGNILPDTGAADVDSEEKRLENYKLQYAELKEKLHSFRDTQFIVWTGRRADRSEHDSRRGATRQGVLRLGQGGVGRAWRQHLRVGLLRARDRGRSLSQARVRERARRLPPDARVRAESRPSAGAEDRRRHRGQG